MAIATGILFLAGISVISGPLLFDRGFELRGAALVLEHGDFLMCQSANLSVLHSLLAFAHVYEGQHDRAGDEEDNHAQNRTSARSRAPAGDLEDCGS